MPEPAHKPSPTATAQNRTLDRIASSPARTALFILATTPLAALLGLLLGRYLLPVIQASFIFPLFFALVRRGRLSRAVWAMSLWAALIAAVMIWFSYMLPGYLNERVLLGESYQHEMFNWIATGEGPEGDIRQFLPQHALHFIIFATATALTMGFLGLAMGSVLMNYMSFYVGTLLAQCQDPATAALLAWPPWAAIRVLAYIITATALAALTLDKAGVQRVHFDSVKKLLLAGGSLLVLDVLLKWSLAPYWQRWLLGLTGW